MFIPFGPNEGRFLASAALKVSKRESSGTSPAVTRDARGGAGHVGFPRFSRQPAEDDTIPGIN